MKKLASWMAVISLLLLLNWCGTKKSADPIEQLDNPTVTSGDVQDFNAIVWWSRYSEVEDKTSIFTFKGDNTFAVTVGTQEARGPWIVSEGKIYLWEEKLELTIVEENKISINGVEYLRNEELY